MVDTRLLVDDRHRASVHRCLDSLRSLKIASEDKPAAVALCERGIDALIDLLESDQDGQCPAVPARPELDPKQVEADYQRDHEDNWRGD
jgi:hypothetical protein